MISHFRNRRGIKTRIKPSIIIGYVGVFAIVVATVSLGYTKPSGSTLLANATAINIDSRINQTSVDEVVASTIAAKAASLSGLPVATSVANLAITNNVKSVMSQSGSSGFTSSKPQLIESTTDNRLVKTHVVAVGDNINSIAGTYNISTQTVRWNNNMSNDNLTVGQTLQILPINGVLYTVKDTDTVNSIASKYKVDETKLSVYNDLDINSLKTGSKIILPDGTLPENERPGYVAPVVYTYSSISYNVGFGGGRTWFIAYGTPDNGLYVHGNCTLYAYNRRKALGLPVGDHWGNANTWAYLASRDGLIVDRTPSVGAIVQNGGYLGHVAIVESILENGDLSISEMNASVAGGGYNIVSGRIILSGNIGQYSYIH